MAKIKVAIFDADKGYRERFADYLMSYKAAEMELAVFTNEQFFYEALDVDKFHLLVLGSGYEGVLARTRRLQVPILVLTEYTQSFVRESVEVLDEQIVYTSRYQSMDVITQKMQLLAEPSWMHKEAKAIHRGLEVVGVFSPVRHEMQMLFSLLYARNAAREQKVLYINLLEFSGFSEVFGDTEYDLGDVVLLVREKEMKLERFLACIYQGEGFSYISPVVNPENIREITAEDVKGVLAAVAEYTDYQMVILDMGLNVSGFAESLLACSKIYCLGKKGYLFEVQMRQFFAYLEKAIDAAFLERIRQVEVPGQAKVICGGINLLEQLDWGDFGDFVRAEM